MKCEKVSQELIAYLDGKLSADVRSEVEKHLANCAACRARAEEFRGVWSVIDQLPAIEPSLGFDARLRQGVAAEPQRGWFAWFVPQARLALAAVLLIALTVWVAKRPTSNPALPLPPAATAASEQDFNAIRNLGVLENYDVVTKMDALAQLGPVSDQQLPKQSSDQNESND
jgi:anti-sigma factor RsiW